MNEGYTQREWDRIVGYGKVPPESRRKEMTDGPFKNAFDADTDGVIRREIITYRMRDGKMIKEEASRDYYVSGDYHDNQNIKPLVMR